MYYCFVHRKQLQGKGIILSLSLRGCNLSWWGRFSSRNETWLRSLALCPSCKNTRRTLQSETGKRIPPRTDYPNTLVPEFQKHIKLMSVVNKMPIPAPGFSGQIILKNSGFDRASPATYRKTDFSYSLSFFYIESKFL